ncbi:MAG: hypothetical protein GY898_22765 [Proteobacteria bacterium]|nr:hypothetical protein [Pseudomonadota bacterium]
MGGTDPACNEGMLGRKNHGGEPRLQAVSAVRSLGCANWMLTAAATAFLGYMADYVFGQAEPDLEAGLMLVAATWGWVVCLSLDLRRWWTSWSAPPDCIVDLDTEETEFLWASIRDPFRNTDRAGPRVVKTAKIGPLFAGSKGGGRATKERPHPGYAMHDGEVDGFTIEVTSRASTGSISTLTSPALGQFPLASGWPILARRLETLGAPASSPHRWWRRDKQLPDFAWTESELESALAARHLPYRDPVLRIAMHRAHARRRTRLERTDFDQAVKRLCGEPVTPANHVAQLAARFLVLFERPAIKWLFVAAMVLVLVAAAVVAVLGYQAGQVSNPF